MIVRRRGQGWCASFLSASTPLATQLLQPSPLYRYPNPLSPVTNFSTSAESTQQTTPSSSSSISSSLSSSSSEPSSTPSFFKEPESKLVIYPHYVKTQEQQIDFLRIALKSFRKQKRKVRRWQKRRRKAVRAKISAHRKELQLLGAWTTSINGPWPIRDDVINRGLDKLPPIDDDALNKELDQEEEANAHREQAFASHIDQPIDLDPQHLQEVKEAKKELKYAKRKATVASLFKEPDEDELGSRNPNDWTCQRCRFPNFSHRVLCAACRSESPTGPKLNPANAEADQEIAATPNSWQCTSCGSHNYDKSYQPYTHVDDIAKLPTETHCRACDELRAQ